jgi:hypothetical protein
MGNKTIIFMSIIISVLIVSVSYQYLQIETLEKDNEKISKEYGYSMDMLSGFLKDKDGMKEQVKAIRSAEIVI